MSFKASTLSTSITWVSSWTIVRFYSLGDCLEWRHPSIQHKPCACERPSLREWSWKGRRGANRLYGDGVSMPIAGRNWGVCNAARGNHGQREAHNQSLPGSQPAEIIAFAPFALAILSRRRRTRQYLVDVIAVNGGNALKRFGRPTGYLPAGKGHKIATSISFSSSTLLTVAGISRSFEDTTNLSSMSGAFIIASKVNRPTFQSRLSPYHHIIPAF